MPASQGMTSHTPGRRSMPHGVRKTQYLTHPPTITPRDAIRPALIEQDIDEPILEENHEVEFYNGTQQAARADRGQRGAGVAEPFMVTRTGSRRRPTR